VWLDVVGIFFPSEDADGGDAVKVDVPQGAEELVPVDVAAADFVVLVEQERRYQVRNWRRLLQIANDL
jgi:hypothetical protein